MKRRTSTIENGELHRNGAFARSEFPESLYELEDGESVMSASIAHSDGDNDILPILANDSEASA